MKKFPPILDILEAVFECYEKQGQQTHTFILSKEEVGEALRGKGFQIADDRAWERLYEFNNSIKIVRETVSTLMDIASRGAKS